MQLEPDRRRTSYRRRGEDEKLVGLKLLLVQPIDAAGKASQVGSLVAADAVGAGVGEEIFFVRGREAQHFRSTLESRPSMPVSSASSIIGTRNLVA